MIKRIVLLVLIVPISANATNSAETFGGLIQEIKDSINNVPFPSFRSQAHASLHKLVEDVCSANNLSYLYCMAAPENTVVDKWLKLKADEP